MNKTVTAKVALCLIDDDDNKGFKKFGAQLILANGSFCKLPVADGIKVKSFDDGSFREVVIETDDKGYPKSVKEVR